jgi:hypothetical protein
MSEMWIKFLSDKHRPSYDAEVSVFNKLAIDKKCWIAYDINCLSSNSFCGLHVRVHSEIQIG